MTPKHTAFSLFMCSLLSGCVVPSHIAYKSHDTPENRDKDVRFHTVYYFRVLDSCLPPKPGRLSNSRSYIENDKYILSDTLYRFTLVGKSNAYFVKTQFEAGILTAAQIDPFGASVKIADDGDVSVSTPQQQQHQQLETRLANQLATLNKQIKDIQEDLTNPSIDDKFKPALEANLSQLYKTRAEFYTYLYPPSGKVDPLEQVSQAVTDVIKSSGNLSNAQAELLQKQLKSENSDNINKLSTMTIEEFLGDIELPTQPRTTETKSRKAAQVVDKPILDKGVGSLISARPSGLCPPGLSRSRGFLIFGPEGWRTFNQDERLILAMYSDAKPLTNTLSQYSQRMTDARVNNASSSHAYTNTLLKWHQAQQHKPSNSKILLCTKTDKSRRSCLEEQMDSLINAVDKD